MQRYNSVTLHVSPKNRMSAEKLKKTFSKIQILPHNFFPEWFGPKQIEAIHFQNQFHDNSSPTDCSKEMLIPILKRLKHLNTVLFCFGGHTHCFGSVQAGGCCATPQPPVVGLWQSPGQEQLQQGRAEAEAEQDRVGGRLSLGVLHPHLAGDQPHTETHQGPAAQQQVFFISWGTATSATCENTY